MNDTENLTGIQKYFKEQNIEFSSKRILIDGLGGMALGLFASLLIGTIIGTLGKYLFEISFSVWGKDVNLFADASTYTKVIQGAAMACAIGYAMKSPPYVLYSLLTVGYASNALGGAGGPMAVYFITLIAIFAGKLVSKRTPVDLIVTPAVTILIGLVAAALIAPPIGSFAIWLGRLVMYATALQPFLMGAICSFAMGIILTLPISSAAICAALGLVGLAGGACVAGCCAHMVGFAVASYKENKLNGLLSQGLGTSMLQVPNLLRKPILWVPPCIASIITGPIATIVFKLQMNGPPISSGMGTSGLVGPIGVIVGWFGPSEQAIAADGGKLGVNLAGSFNGAFDWIGLILICVVLPAVISYIVTEYMRKRGWIQFGDYKLDL